LKAGRHTLTDTHAQKAYLKAIAFWLQLLNKLELSETHFHILASGQPRVFREAC